MRTLPFFPRVFGIGLLLLNSYLSLLGQSRLVVNGATITITQSAYLVIDNPAANAITRNSGYITSEGQNNNIKWNIGTTQDNYSIPWGYNSTYIPLSFSTASGTGSGYFLFSTYHTGWQNSVQLPTGVANMNGTSGTDHSAFEADRFWKISEQGYTVKPLLSNMVFTYPDAEYLAQNNTINESAMVAKSYNSTINSWNNNVFASADNTANNTVTVPSVGLTDLNDWWVLGTLGKNFYWVAPSASTSNISTNWSQTSGGAGSATMPTSLDAVIFDGASNANCVVNANLTAASLIVNAGYKGSITQGISKITLNSSATFSGGSFIGGSADITVGGAFTVSGTTFTSTSGTLDLKKDLTVNSGSFAHNNGTIKFSGTDGVTQNINGSVTSNFNNMSVTNTAANPGVSIQSNQNLLGVLTLASNVVFDADGSGNSSVFKLISSSDKPTSDAAIAAIPSGAQITGNVTVQRYMGRSGVAVYNYQVWRDISSPVNSTVSDLQKSLPVIGSFTGTSIVPGATPGAASMFGYTESVITDMDGSGSNTLDDGWIDFPADNGNSATTSFDRGRGYSIFIFGVDAPVVINGNANWSLTGPIWSGGFNLPVTYNASVNSPTGNLANDGWNLVGNPYPSTIDWKATSWVKTNVDDAIYMDDYSTVNPVFATFVNNIGTNGGTRYIATGQGFWVKANAASPVITINENVKVAGTQTRLFRASSPANLLRATLITSDSLRDETVIYFSDSSSVGFDPKYDARKLRNQYGYLNLSSISPSKDKYAINAMPFSNCTTMVPLDVSDVTTGTYSLSFSEFESIPSSFSIQLQDNLNNSIIDIRQNQNYSFSIDQNNAATFGSSRFSLTFDYKEQLVPMTVLSPSVCDPSLAKVTVTNSSTDYNYTFLSSSDSSAVVPVVSGTGSNLSFYVASNKLVEGSNGFRISQTNKYCSSLTATTNTNLVYLKAPAAPTVKSSISCGPGTITFTANGGPADGYYNWYDSLNGIAPYANQTTSTFITSPLTRSKTYYVSSSNSLGCEGERTAVVADVVNLNPAYIIAVDLFTLQSNYVAGNQWTFNDQVISRDTAQTIKPTQSGLYKLKVTSGSCSVSAEMEFVVTGTTDLSTDSEVRAYPNPVRGILTIEIDGKNKAGGEILNALGATISPVSFESDGQKQSAQYNFTNESGGIYLIRINQGDKTVIVKVVKD